MAESERRTGLLKAASTAAAVALAALAAYYLTGLDRVWHPDRYSDFGLGMVGSSVVDVTPGSDAAKAGIRVGDTLKRPSLLRDRMLLYAGALATIRPGDRVTVTVRGSQGPRTVALAAPRVARVTLTDTVSRILLDLSAVVFVFVGSLLVLLRPSKMTWTFYLAGLCFALVFVYPVIDVPPAIGIALAIAGFAILGIGPLAFSIFCLQFPANEPAPGARAVVRVASYAAVPAAGLLIWYNLLQLDFGNASLIAALGYLIIGFTVAAVVAGIVGIALIYFRAHGLARFRIRWVLLGIVCFGASAVVAVLNIVEGASSPTAWLASAFYALFGVLPATVAYAVLKHRVIDVRFVLVRSLAAIVSVAIVGVTLVAVSVAFGTTMPRTRLEATTYAMAVLLIGFAFSVVRERIFGTVDAVLFPQWHGAKERARRIGTQVHSANLPAQLYDPLTGGIAAALSIASAALFERVHDDGGFVRVAAHGWLTGTLWHILPDEALVGRLNARARATILDVDRWSTPRLPSGAARPTHAFPFFSGPDVTAVLLVGAHNDGTAIDPDEARIIVRLCSDAGLVYRYQGVA